MTIFISYRREDSAGHAGRLFDHLVSHFGMKNVFMDIDTIEPGDDFRKVVKNAMGTCDVVLVMIGKDWLNIRDQQGQRRLENPRDWVRVEVATALANPQILVIPVLVRGAAMPGEQDLPEELKELPYRNAIELSDSRFQHDVNKLIKVIEKGKAKQSKSPAILPSKIRGAGFWGVTIVIVALGLILWQFRNGSPAEPDSKGEPDITITVTDTPTATWKPTHTPVLTGTPTHTPTATGTPSPDPQAALALEIVQLIDDYYTCLNSANPNDRDDSDYEKCWNLLSDRPGEIQSNSSKKEFIDYWKKFKATYELYFCLNNGQPFVHSRYFIYNRNNDFQPIRSDPYYLEFVLAHDSSGWRIKGANYLENIGSFCESQPRVSKVEVP